MRRAAEHQVENGDAETPSRARRRLEHANSSERVAGEHAPEEREGQRGVAHLVLGGGVATREGTEGDDEGEEDDCHDQYPTEEVLKHADHLRAAAREWSRVYLESG